MSENMLQAYHALLRFPESYLAPSFEEFMQAHSTTAPTSIRLHPIKAVHTEIDILSEATSIPTLSAAFELSSRPAFIKDPLWHAGAYYVQEANSMYIGQIIQHIKSNTDAPLRILDLCAAPGGKSTHIASMLSAEDLLISNEIHPQRAEILYENAVKWGYDNIWVSNNAPQDFSGLKNYFDIIVIDAPCSGSGMWRKDKDTINEWSVQNVALCSERQKDILNTILPCLKNKGILIYSTCSYSQEENEEIVDYVVDNYHATNYPWQAEGLESRHHSSSPLHKIPCFRRAPWDSNGEGFFFAVLQIEQDTHRSNNHKFKPAPALKLPTELPLLPSKKVVTPAEDIYAFIHEQHEADRKILIDQKKLRLKKVGTLLGTVLKKQWNPDHEWALSIHNVDSAHKSVSVDEAMALDYLRRENISLEDIDKGWILIDYKYLHLGWIKSLGNRVNNYYPKNWRIRFV